MLQNLSTFLVFLFPLSLWLVAELRWRLVNGETEIWARMENQVLMKTVVYQQFCSWHTAALPVQCSVRIQWICQKQLELSYFYAEVCQNQVSDNFFVKQCMKLKIFLSICHKAFLTMQVTSIETAINFPLNCPMSRP